MPSTQATTEAESIMSQTQTQIKLLEETVTKNQQKYDEIIATLAVMKQKRKDHNSLMEQMKNEQSELVYILLYIIYYLFSFNLFLFFIFFIYYYLFIN